jgi:ADP-ribose pyrophosphatase YjhB (NUDIX family)
MTDITFDLNGYRNNLRVGAIVTHGDEILLCRQPDQDWWLLPGGRIKTDEDSRAALQRELTEEIGSDFSITRPIICAENFFELDGHNFHEICIFYEVTWLGGESLSPQDNGDEEFEWMPRQDVAGIDLRPAFAKAFITNPYPELQLVINRETAAN